MLLTEYDYDTDIAVQRQEAYEDGSQQAKIETAKNLLTMSLSIENIAKATGLTIEEIKALAK
jgi:predicted transposase/invertase (TIGR01784 family)